MSLFTEAEEKRIASAITNAERKTSGEIVAVVAAQSESYLYVPFLWAALIALLVPWVLIYFSWLPVQSIYLVQLLVFAGLLFVFLMPSVRMALVPKPVRRIHAHRRAIEQFLVQNLHTTKGRTGVLIFVSIAERYAEVLADLGIHEKVPENTWQEIVEELAGRIGEGRAVDGFVSAIEATGKHLALHFPPGTAEPNELPNHLIVLN